MDKKHYQGKYKVINKNKYIGNIDNIWYRSSWECHFMSWLDKTNDVIEWKSEEIIIPYISPIDGKWHRYFPDFYFKLKTKKGIKQYLIEIKPANQVSKPKEPKRKTKQYMNKLLTWLTNQQKWEQAIKYAQNNNMEFKIITEHELFGKKK